MHSTFHQNILVQLHMDLLLSLGSHPEMQSPVYGSQSPVQSHGRQPYSPSPQYPIIQLSQRGPPTPGLQVHSPLLGLQRALPPEKTEPTGWQEQAAEERGDTTRVLTSL